MPGWCWRPSTRRTLRLPLRQAQGDGSGQALARNVDGQTIRDTAATVVLFGQEAPAVPLLQL